MIHLEYPSWMFVLTPPYGTSMGERKENLGEYISKTCIFPHNFTFQSDDENDGDDNCDTNNPKWFYEDDGDIRNIDFMK